VTLASLTGAFEASMMAGGKDCLDFEVGVRRSSKLLKPPNDRWHRCAESSGAGKVNRMNSLSRQRKRLYLKLQRKEL
jgi:hypothetical protein